MGAVVSIVAIVGFVLVMLSPVIIGGKYAQVVSQISPIQPHWERRYVGDEVHNVFVQPEPFS